MIVAKDVTLRRGGRPLLDGVSVRLEPGGLVAVIGPNGAGKSTLLSVLAGLVAPDAGSVMLDGIALSEIPKRALARRRAYLPQSPRAEWPIPVERLVALGLMPHLPVFGGLPAASAAAIDAALVACDLVDRRHQPVTTLSGGELARAMLARALVGNPAVLIADEPLAGLDPRHALDGMMRLRSRALAGTLIIVALHDLTLAARYASHVVALREGRLVAQGPVATTLDSHLIRALFDVEASISREGRQTHIDLSPLAS